MAVVGNGTPQPPRPCSSHGTAVTTRDYKPAAAFPRRAVVPPWQVDLGQPSCGRNGVATATSAAASPLRAAGGNSTAKAGLHPPDGGGRAGRQGEQQQRVLVRIIVFYDGKPITNAYTPLFYDSLHCFMAERRLVVKQTTIRHGFCGRIVKKVDFCLV